MDGGDIGWTVPAAQQTSEPGSNMEDRQGHGSHKLKMGTYLRRLGERGALHLLTYLTTLLQISNLIEGQLHKVSCKITRTINLF